MNDIMLNIAIGVGLMILELAIIKTFMDRYIANRNRMKWLPFRAMFYGAVYNYHDELMRIWESWDDRQRSYLQAVKDRGHLELVDVDNLKAVYKDTLDRKERARALFQESIQTSAPSLTPDAGPYCHEPLYFDDIIQLYAGECARTVEAFDLNQLHNRDYVDNTLKTLWAKQQSMKIVMFRFRQFPSWLEQRVAESEGLMRYRGNFVPERAYHQAVQTEHQIAGYERDSRKIPRTSPVLAFFDQEFKL